MENNRLILNAILEILPKQVFVSGSVIEPWQLYVPNAHKKALQLYSNIVVGDRGVGKSTWTLALYDKQLCASIGAKVKELENVSVHIGFAEVSNLDEHPSKAIIKDLLQKNYNPHDIWKSVVTRWLSREIGEKIPVDKWDESVSWVKDNSELYIRILEKANNEFKIKDKNGLILFDALDRLSDSWEEIDNITRELLRFVLELKAFSNIHAKVFLRTDQFSRNITNFPDASKLLSTKTELNWGINDLHWLLWQQLYNASGEGGNILREYYNNIIGIHPIKQDNYCVIANDISTDNTKQRTLFEKLAGPSMGKDRRRGVPYIWIVSHLADGNKKTSPRSFLDAIKTAADDSLKRSGDYPLHYESIKKGVQSASQIRVDEIAEDYPWINDLCRPLAGKNVPAHFTDFEKIWKDKYPNGPSMITSKNLPPQELERGWYGIVDELTRLGVFDTMRDGRINMPDLFRVGFRLGRKGGVPPVG